MATFNPGANRPLQRGGGAPGFRFALYALVSIILMFLDQSQRYLEQTRYLLQGAAYPLQLAVSSPAKALSWLHENMQARDVLRAENQRLLNRQHELELQAMRVEALERENGQLRGLRDALPPVADRWLVAEIVDVPLDRLRQRILLNRGANNGLFKGQTLIDDAGVLGQTTHVGPWSAEVILITDPEHAIPVQIVRNNLRTIAFGTGDALALPYLPANADIKKGDVLVTSGLGGVFPAGYPVAKVTEVHRDAVQPLAQVRAVPFAHIDTDREVVLVWFREGHPAAPVQELDGDLKTGNAALQPQAAPPRPHEEKPPRSSAAASSAAASASANSLHPVAATTPAAPPPPTAGVSRSATASPASAPAPASSSSQSAQSGRP